MARGSALRIALLTALALTAGFAFRALADYDPDAGIRGVVGGVEGWFFSPTGRSPTFIFAVSVLIFVGRGRRLLAAIANGRPEPVLAGGLLSLAAIAFAWSHYVGGPDLLVPALIPVIPGAAAALGGRGAARAVMLPSLFLLLAVPPPAVLINQVIYPLQILTAQSATWVLNLVGVDALRQGDLILTRHGIFQVIESCSGLRTAETLLMSALLYGEIFHRQRWCTAVFVLAVPLISFLANQARVISIVLNPFSHVSEVHSLQGIVVLVGGVLGIALLDGLLVRFFPQRVRLPRELLAPPRVGLECIPVLPLGVLIGVMATFGVASLAIQPWQPGPRVGQTLYDFPHVLRGWNSRSLDVETQFLGTVRFTERINRSYASPDGERSIDLFIGIDEHLQRNFSLISRKTQIPTTGDTISSRRSANLGEEAMQAGVIGAEILTLESGGRRWLVMHWYENVEPTGIEVLRSLLALDRSSFRRPLRSTVVRIAVPLVFRGERGDGFDEAYREALDFVPVIREALAAFESGTWTDELRRRLAAPGDDSDAS